MRKLNKTAACGILAAALAAGTLSGCSKAIDGTKTVATVGDEKVTLGLASYMVRDQQAQTMSYYNMLMSAALHLMCGIRKETTGKLSGKAPKMAS